MVSAMLLATLAFLFSAQDPIVAPVAGVVAGPTGALTADAVESLDLGNGCRLQGRVLRSTEQTIFLDVGYDVLKVPMAAVVRRESADGGKSGGIVREKLWARAELPERSVAEGSKLMGEAVVKIEAAGGQGSGFVTHADGWIVTNFHVVEREVEVDVVVYPVGKNGFEPRTVRKCKVAAINPAMDLAIVKMEAPADLRLKSVYLGDSDGMEVGATVYAIGAPIA